MLRIVVNSVADAANAEEAFRAAFAKEEAITIVDGQTGEEIFSVMQTSNTEDGSIFIVKTADPALEADLTAFVADTEGVTIRRIIT